MTVRALKKKNKMKGPFKLRSGNSPLFKYMGSSPVQKDIPTGRGTPPPSKHEDQIAHEIEQRKSSKSSKTSYKQAWDNMSDDQKNKHGSFEKFKAAAEKYNKEN